MEQRTINPPTTLEFVAPSQEELEAQSLDFLKTCRRSLYRDLRGTGDLGDFLKRRANRARGYARNLMASGVWETEAWNRAIRLEILESESD